MSGDDQQFKPPGRLLFRMPFNVDATTAAGFVHFIELVVQRLSNLIQGPRHHGMSTTVLPRPQAAQRTWFVIELQSQGYSVPVFIEAETIYMHGYQNMDGVVFEFQRKSPGDNIPPPGPYLGDASRELSFGCSYADLERASRQMKGDVGLALQVPQQGSEKRMPNFGQQRLIEAVKHLAIGENLHGQSQHETAQNLLLVIVRFCESMRFRSILTEMADLWTNPSRCLSKHCFGQINNWNKLAIKLQACARNPAVVWPKNLADETGVGSATQAQDILVLVMFHEDGNESNKPEWIPPPDNINNNNRRHHGGPGGGAGAAGGVYAAELPVTRWLPVPQEPVMKILGVYVPRQPGLTGVYGTVTVDDGLGAQAIFGRSRVNYQSYSGDSKMTLELNVLDRSVSAADSWGIHADLWSASTDAPLSTGRITSSIYDFPTDAYDQVMTKTIGQAVLKYVVYSSATAIVDTDDDVTFELLGPGSSSTVPPDYYRYDDDATSDPTSSPAGPHQHDEL